MLTSHLREEEQACFPLVWLLQMTLWDPTCVLCLFLFNKQTTLGPRAAKRWCSWRGLCTQPSACHKCTQENFQATLRCTSTQARGQGKLALPFPRGPSPSTEPRPLPLFLSVVLKELGLTGPLGWFKVALSSILPACSGVIGGTSTTEDVHSL